MFNKASTAPVGHINVGAIGLRLSTLSLVLEDSNMTETVLDLGLDEIKTIAQKCFWVFF